MMKSVKEEKRASDLKRTLLYHASRWILGIVFIYASYDKILHPAEFSKSVYNYQLIPDFLINLTALMLPWLELILGISLLFGALLSGSILISNLLLMLFSAALIFNLYRGIDVNCGCFSTSPGEKAADILTVLRDGSFMCFSFYLFYYHFFWKKWSASRLESTGGHDEFRMRCNKDPMPGRGECPQRTFEPAETGEN